MDVFDTINWDSFEEALPPPAVAAKSAPKPAPGGAPASAPVAPLPAGAVPKTDPAAAVPAGKVGKVAGMANKDALGGAVTKLGINPDEVLKPMEVRHDPDDIIDKVIECLERADTQEDEGSLQACLAVAEHYMTIAEFLGQAALDQKKALFDAQLQLLQHQQQLYQADQMHQQKMKASTQQLALDQQVNKKLADQKISDAKTMSAHKIATQKTATQQKMQAQKTAASATKTAAPVATKKPAFKPREEIPGQGSLFLE